MKKINNWRKCILTLTLISFFCGVLPVNGQDLVAVNDISGGSSVFVFRSSSKSSPKKFVSVTKTKRTKAQRVETAKRVTKQFTTVAKVQPRRTRSKSYDPNNLPPSTNTMPKDQVSRIFAGVGEYYMDNDETDKAVEFFRESVTLDAKNANAKNGLSEALALKGNKLLIDDKADLARFFFEDSLKNNPKNAVAYYGLGEVLAQLDKDNEALANYEQALQLDKDLTEIYVPLGILYYQKGEIAKADEFLTKALAASSDDAETQYFLGLVRYSQNRNQEALTAFRKAVAADANNAETHFYVGESLARLNQDKEAIVEYNEAIRLKPQYFEALFALGSTYYKLENYADAAKTFDLARKLKSDNIAVRINLGDTYRQLGNYNDSESNYNSATLFISRDPNFSKEEAAEVYSNIGFVLGKQCEINLRRGAPCKWVNAIQSLEKAIELSPNAADYTNLGWAYYNSAKLDIGARKEADAKPKLENAKIALQKAIALNPKFAEAPLLNLGTVLIDLGEYPAAIEALKQVDTKRNDWAFVNYALGVAYRKNNNIDDAIKQFRKALDKESNYVAALAGLGESEFRKGNKKETEKVIERLKKLNPNEANKLEIMMKLSK